MLQQWARAQGTAETSEPTPLLLCVLGQCEGEEGPVWALGPGLSTD